MEKGSGLTFKAVDPTSEDFKSNEDEKDTTIVGEGNANEDGEGNEEGIEDDGNLEDTNAGGEEGSEEEEEEVEVYEDDKILAQINKKYGKEFSKIEDLFVKPEKEELPEDIKRLMEFGVENYIKINKDWDKETNTNVLIEYYKQTKPHLDEEDIDSLLEDSYSFDEDIDEEKDIKRKKRELKEELFRAKTYLNEQKEKYKVDFGQGSTEVPEDYKKAFEFLQEYESTKKTDSEKAEEKSKVFREKTEKLFSSDFKGFEFSLGDDKKQIFKPKDVNEVKEGNSDITAVINSHLDKNGMLKDAHQYHKALAMFRDPDGFAKFFYEQGKADATGNVIKDVKNIEMSVRDIKDTTNPNAIKVRTIGNDDFSNGLKIKKRT